MTTATCSSGRITGPVDAPAPRRARGQVDAIVLDLLIRANGPQTAYDLASGAGHAGERLAPAQIYRALDRLRDRGRIIRVESLSAWIVQPRDHDAWLVCTACHRVQGLAMPRVTARLLAHARQAGFTTRRIIMEQRSLCNECQR